MRHTSSAPAANQGCSLDRVDFEGWDAFRLANGIIELFVVPQIGGRVIQLRLGEHPYFYIHPDHRGRVYPPAQNDFATGWKNYGGSKVWPAPQGWLGSHQWPGPPGPVLDGGPYECKTVEDSDESVALLLTSGADEYTGLGFVREVRIFKASSTVRISHTMRNVSPRVVRWSIWQVTQQTADEHFSMFVPFERYWQSYGEQPYEAITPDASRRLLRMRYYDRVAKFAVEPHQGWLATHDGKSQAVLAQIFALHRGLPYPDAAAEFWINAHGTFVINGETIDSSNEPHGCDPYVETEILSPQVQLQPGGEYSTVMRWHCAILDADEIVAVDECAATGSPLGVSRSAAGLVVRGSFGVFHAGSLELLGITVDGLVKSRLALGEVNPLKPCVVDQTVPDDAELAQVTLILRSAGGEVVRPVSEASVPPPV
jgi:hypothetical protein